ncbi:hypothetical protein [Paractinoplanes globisporus]|uniref:Uncharacterized protein n=1 Tax=Paractinoplanes globisporus TaxID=113565 RepID=A0ABW6W692_9ACTN|nr:hypothetical protein [Actinoplanes globisporus]
MRAKRYLAGATAGVAVLAVIAGCAGQIKQLEPKLQLRSAAQHLGEQKQAGFTLKLTGSADDLIAAAKKDDPDFSDDDAATMKKLFNSSFTVAYDQAGEGTDDDRALLAATIDGVTGTEIRVVDQTLYAKAPVNDLVTKFGGSTADIDDIRRQATAEDKALGAFFDGGWVSLDVKDVQKTSGLPAADATNPKAAAEVKKSAQNLFDNAQIARDPKDDKHLIVTTSTTKAYSELKRLVTAVGGEEAKGFEDSIPEAPKDRPIVVDLWIDQDKLTAAEINILQFVDGATGRVAVRLEVTSGSPIDAPQGATKIDPKLLQSLTSAGANGAGEDVVTAAQSLGYDTLSLADENGGTPASHLKEAVADFAGSGVKARIVRSGVAEVTLNGDMACLKLPATTTGGPKVTAGAC